MTKAFKLVVILALLSLLASAAFAVIPAPLLNVSVSTDTVNNTLTWHVTNLTSATEGFKLVRIDWLYPVYDVSNIAPTSWSFAKNQIAPDEVNDTDSVTAVTWKTTVANGLDYNQSMDFTIHSVPPVVDQKDPFPLHVAWQRTMLNTPDGEPSSMDIGVVPEPESFLVLTTGIMGICGLTLRKRK